jgi:hypothetical protein
LPGLAPDRTARLGAGLVAALALAACRADDASTNLAQPSASAPNAALTSRSTVLAMASSAADTAASAARDRAREEAASAAPCPAEMALVGRVCVDRHEAHLVVVQGDGSFERHPHVQRPTAGVRYQARSEAGVFPQAYISGEEAQAACDHAGKRLCTMVEWRRACQGTRWSTFMNGKGKREEHCNTGKAHLLPLKFGNDPKRWRYDEHFNDPSLGLEPGFLAHTGAHPDCKSDAGAFDMVGNLHEWVSDRVSKRLVENIEADNVGRHAQPWTEGNGVFMGGFFSTYAELGPGCLFTTLAHEPAYHDYSTGFRCCAAARPSSPPQDAPHASPRRPAVR